MLRASMTALGAVVLLTSASASTRAQLVVEPTQDPGTMVDALIDAGIEVVDVHYDAAPDVLWWSLFPFSDGPGSEAGTSPSALYRGGPLGLRDGLLLTSGESMLALPPNRSLPGTASREGATGVLTPDLGPPRNGQPAEPFCAGMIGDATINPHDVVKLTIDFTLAPGFDGIQLDYVFGSEEYPDYVGQLYPDAFGFFVRAAGSTDYVNFGRDPNGNDIDINGSFFSGTNVVETFGDDALEVSEYNGLTPHLRSAFPLAGGPDRIHRVVIVLCDAGDQYLDSGVFLTALAGCNGNCNTTTWCGDGVVQAGEGCDDGDTSAGDGCDASCTVEPGWACTKTLGQLSVCSDKCGDGTVQLPWEQCDDDDGDDRDDCTNACRLPTCSDGIQHDGGSGTETGVDCGGVCPGCVDGDPCETHTDCASAFCTAAKVCAPAPVTVARDDIWRVLVGQPATRPVSELLANDQELAPASFSIPTTTVGGAALSIVGNNIRWAPVSGATADDSFEYRVCNPFVPAQCDTATVTIIVNRPPVITDVVTWVAVGTAQVVVPRAQWFSDADGDAIGDAAVESPGNATLAGSLTFAPGPAGVVQLDLEACDAGFPTGCDAGVWTVNVNDPPTVLRVEVTLASGAGAVVGLDDYLADLGLVTGDSPSDGDADGLERMFVSNAADGIFVLVQPLGVGTCSIDPTTGVVDLAASPSITGSSSCWVRVCEELPVDDERVCSAAEIVLTVVPCVVDADCGAPSPVCADTNVCVACADSAAGAGLDQGCSALAPLCSGDRCAPCLDDAAAGAIDTGCVTVMNACDPGLTSPRCVDCQADADCAAGDACEPATKTCVPCRDSAASPAVDAGCVSAAPVCLTFIVGPDVSGECVECLADGDCDSGVCDPAAHVCVGCRDTVGGAGRDAGCPVIDPMCIVADERCVPCVDDRGERDTGCGTLTPVCLGAAGDERCVGCDVDADCALGVCGDNACVPCLDSAVGAALDRGCSASDPMCEDEACVPCVDDATFPAADRGCGDDTPSCHEAAPGGARCAGCVSDLDCPSDAERCELDLDVCVACLGDDDCQSDERCIVAAHVCIDRDTSRAIDDAYTTNEGVPLVVAVADGLVPNDLIPTGLGAPVVTVVAPPSAASGALVVQSNGALRFTPASGVHGTVTFTYELVTAPAPPTRATVTIVVNGAPDAAPDVAQTTPAQPVTIPVLNNDDDPEGDALTLTRIVDQPDHGGVSTVGGALTYTPASGYVGLDTLAYEVCDPKGACSTAVVAITVIDTSTPVLPRGWPDFAKTPEDTAVVIFVAVNDDPALTFAAIEEPPLFGQVEVLAAGVVLYTPPAGWSGRDAFTYRSCAVDACVVVWVVVVVGDSPDPIPDNASPPIAVDDRATTPKNTPVTLYPLNNDVDPDGDALTVLALGAALHGTVATDGQRATYTPATDYQGEDHFEVVITDGVGTASSLAYVTVLPAANRPPLADDDRYVVSHIAGRTLPVHDNDSDPDADVLVLSYVTQPAEGTLRMVGGALTYSPTPLDPARPLAEQTFRYGVADPFGASDDALVTLTLADTDGDGLTDLQEVNETNTDPEDADTDDDGLSDGAEVNGVTSTDPTLCDSDGDGLCDGLEQGVTTPDADTDPSSWQPDLDPDSTTDPNDADTDDGSVSDGDEDSDKDGRVDDGERDPNLEPDDVAQVEPEAEPQPEAAEPRGLIAEGGGCTTGAGAWWCMFAIAGVSLGRRKYLAR